MSFAGDLNRIVVVERHVPGEVNEFNEPVDTWVTFIRYFANRTDVRDSEKVAAGQVSGSLMSRFVMRSSSDSKTINTKDRLSHDGKTWEIHGVKEKDKTFIEITASTQID